MAFYAHRTKDGTVKILNWPVGSAKAAQYWNQRRCDANKRRAKRLRQSRRWSSAGTFLG